MAFLESPRFPDNISYGSSGGPKFNSVVTTVNSGYEYTNINWDQARHSYNVGMGVRTEDELYDLITFFKIVRGKGHRFRYKDWADYKTCAPSATPTATDEVFGIGDGATTQFQLVKTYDLGGGLVNIRTINKPVDGTVLVSLNDVTQTEGGGNDYTIDYTTGIVTFNSAPGASVGVKWGGEYDVPCRFDTDELQVSLDFYGYGSTEVNVIEVKV